MVLSVEANKKRKGKYKPHLNIKGNRLKNDNQTSSHFWIK